MRKLTRLVREDEDRDGLRNVGFFTAQPFDPADSPRKLHRTCCLLDTLRNGQVTDTSYLNEDHKP
jgi:hypothetical protein